MTTRQRLVWSSIGKKLVSGITGLALCGFVAVHLAENILLLVGQDEFNGWVHFLEGLGYGVFVPIAEVGLGAFFVFHVITGVQVWLDRRRARGGRYVKVGNAGGPSQKTVASRSMMVTGTLLFIFLVAHVWMFRFGPGIDEGYAADLHGEQVWDLYRLVIEWFKVEWVVAAYVGMMVLLGVHLSHGFWSAFQSLGANNPRYMSLITTLGFAFALLMAVGFMLLPLLVYFFVDTPMASTVTGVGLS